MIADTTDSPGGADPGATGDPRVEAAVAALDGLAQRPANEHVGVLEAVHRALHETLATIDGT